MCRMAYSSEDMRISVVIRNGLKQMVRKEVLNALHSGCRGTFGIRQETGETERAILLARAYRRGLQLVSNLFNMCSKEITCQRNKAKLQGIHPGYPLQLVAMDLLGPLPESTNKNFYVLVVADYTEAYALPNQEARILASKLVKEFSPC